MTRASLVLLALLLGGCTPDAPLSAALPDQPVPVPAPAPAPEPEEQPAQDGPIRQPNGVPFPLPQFLPVARRVDAEAPAAGPEPLAFWVGGKGTRDGAFNYPRAIATGKDGAVYIVDKSGRIQKWAADGRLLAVVRTPEIEQGKPTGLGIDADGNLLVADTHYCRVLTYSPDLELLRCYGAPGPAQGQFMLLTSARAGADGLHYTTDYGDTVARVQVFKADGTLVRSFGTFGDGPLQFQRPMALCVDDERDRLYVADAVNHRISVFTRAGEHITAFGGNGSEPGQLKYPYDVKRDADGRVWVAEFGNQRVSVFDTDGRSLGVWGGPGRRLGAVNRVWGVTLVTGGRFWVLDSAGDRAYALSRSVVISREAGS